MCFLKDLRRFDKSSGGSVGIDSRSENLLVLGGLGTLSEEGVGKGESGDLGANLNFLGVEQGCNVLDSVLHRVTGGYLGIGKVRGGLLSVLGHTDSGVSFRGGFGGQSEQGGSDFLGVVSAWVFRDSYSAGIG